MERKGIFGVSKESEVIVDILTFGAAIFSGIAAGSFLVSLAMFCGIAAIIVTVRVEARKL